MRHSECFPVATCLSLLLQDNLRFIGHDINVTGVWENNITGHGIVVSVIDDGKEISLYRYVYYLTWLQADKFFRNHFW